MTHDRIKVLIIILFKYWKQILVYISKFILKEYFENYLNTLQNKLLVFYLTTKYI